eukprot:TRINITY_DN60705_c0_g1_i1.p1 TRINITY_DN60705_c0_g1~~TRINITY_DN60705_c0_g1_i1.p1  ORF type:complete len:543 (+),score=111.47 TRINITY_DN60705_c0_g1_i1:221-1630(+)
MVRSHDIEAYSLTFDAKKMVNSELLQAAMKTGDGNECVEATAKEMKRQEEEGADSPEEVCAFVAAYKPDIVVGHVSLANFHIVAERYGLPVVNAMFMPWLPSRVAYSAFTTLAAVTEKGQLDTPLETHRQLYDSWMDGARLEEFNKTRERWGLLPYSSVSEMQGALQAIPTANCWSVDVIPEPSDLAAEFPLSKQTGYSFLDEPEYTAPEALRAFLEAPGKSKPVYIGFGSLSAGDPREVTEKVLRALLSAGRKRCVMAGGWSGIGPEHLHPELTEDYMELKRFADANVFKIEAAPHSWLLPQCCAALHHGGAGTTGAVARAGIPTAIAPFAWDQPFWAERMEHLGVGVALSTMITKLDVQELALAIQRLAEDTGMAERAAALGARICSERSGTERLAEFIEGSVNAPFAWPTKTQPLASAVPLPLWHRPIALNSSGVADDTCGVQTEITFDVSKVAEPGHQMSARAGA